MAVTAAILLAAGRSVRFGRDKTAMVVEGETLVQRHVRQLRDAGVAEVIAVCNETNEPAIRAYGIATVLQRGETMSAAVLTGLRHATVDSAWLVCVNDLISDTAYRTIARQPLPQNAIAIATFLLAKTFHGGHLELAPDSDRVQRIVEKPLGGCPPGAWANIMIHRLRGRWLVERLAALLGEGVEYESAVNVVIGEGVTVVPVAVDDWRAIKTPDDFPA